MLKVVSGPAVIKTQGRISKLKHRGMPNEDQAKTWNDLLEPLSGANAVLKNDGTLIGLHKQTRL